MSQVRAMTGFAALTALLIALLLAGCSNPNTQAYIDPDTGKHAPNWVSAHGSSFISNSSDCMVCHGIDLHGGISGVSCFSSSFNGVTCHPNGPGHTLANWSDGAVHGPEAEKDFWYCKICHGQSYKGGQITSVSCYDCHNGPGLNHPNPGWVVPLTNPPSAPYHKTDTANCAKCHGATYTGGGAHVPCAPCHMQDRTRVHILAWYQTSVQSAHRSYAANNGTGLCQNGYCHGAPTLTVDVWNGLSGPHCNGTCHSWPPD